MRFSPPRLGLALLCLAYGPAQGQVTAPRDLTQVSLEDLMNVEVTSVSKKDQKLSKTPAAVFVMSQDDISHSSARDIPELLRMVPGVDVAQVDANRWAISIRGFNQLFGNKVLVLIDGRSIYTNVGSNVFWDDHLIPLEDIERIEVIRGPGGTVWGANAVNGVINIISRNAKATQGGLITAGGGSQTVADGLAQYGGKVGSAGAYRVFGGYFNVNNSAAPGGQSAGDGWHASQAGFRTDWDLSSKDSLTVQGDFADTEGGQTVNTVFANDLPRQGVVNDRQTNTAGEILGRWNHTFANGSDTSLQISSDVEHRRAQFEVTAIRKMTDVDFHHHLSFGSRNDIVWGFGYRFETEDLRPGFAVTIQPLQSADNLFSGFVQDEMQITQSLSLTLGSKFEHNSSTGYEYEPSAQLTWAISNGHTVWASAARAIRQPALVDFGIQRDVAIVPLPNGSFGVPTLLGNPQIQAEQLRDYEAGYRTQLNRRLYLDLTAFWSFYRRLITQEPGAPFFTATPAPPHIVIPLVWGNKAHAFSQGAELAANWDVHSRWRLRAGYSYLDLSIRRDPSSVDPAVSGTAGNSPKHQWQIDSRVNVSRNMDWDTTLLYVARLPNLSVPAYTRLDTKFRWRLGEFVELSVVGQSLLRNQHFEFSDPGIHAAGVPRNVFGKITWRF